MSDTVADGRSEPDAEQPGNPTQWLLAAYFGLHAAASILLLLSRDRLGWASGTFEAIAVERARTDLALAAALAIVLVRFGWMRRLLWARVPIRAHHRPDLYALTAASLAAAVLIALVGFIVLTGVAPPMLGGPPPGQPPLWFVAQNAVLLVLVAPVVEELVFRGVLTEQWRADLSRGVLTSRWKDELSGFWPRSLLLAGMFAFMHNGLGWFALGAPVVVSLLASYTRERTGNLGMAVLVHATWNATVFVLAEFIVRFA